MRNTRGFYPPKAAAPVLTPAAAPSPTPLPPPPLATPVIPYATPIGAGVSSALTAAWRGKALIVPDGASIADRCIRCNAESDGKPIRRNLSWHHQALFLLVLFPGLLIYIIVALIVRRRATVYVGLCQRHRQQRRVLILAAWGIVLASIGVLLMPAIVNARDLEGFSIVGGIAGLVIGGIFGVWVSQQLGYPARIDRPFVWLRGVNRGYPAPRS